jgi:hypothetical protein
MWSEVKKEGERSYNTGYHFLAPYVPYTPSLVTVKSDNFVAQQRPLVRTIQQGNTSPAFTGSAYEHFFSQQLVKNMEKAMKITYPVGEIVVEQTCPMAFFEYLTHDWATFQPIVNKPGFHYYRKCSDPQLLERTLPGLRKEKVLCTVQLGSYISDLQVKPSSPVRVMYNHSRQLLALSFYHQPRTSHLWTEEMKENWTPPIRVEPRRTITRQQYWQDTQFSQQNGDSTWFWHAINEDISFLQKQEK